MNNFTPLKTKNKKKKANKFLIIGNLLLVIIVAGVGFFTIGVMAPKSYALGPTGQYYYQPYKFGSRTLGIGTGITLCFIGVFETISEKKKMRN